MRKSIAALISFGIILLVILIFGIEIFDEVWSFPGNIPFIKDLPSENMPLGSIPLMVIILSLRSN